ncbi:MAG: NAD-dependent epimerase/dehydratase family protein [Desulfotignum sp.]|nr:NAD-dependent epimerase/dehydratase family protein [Desulfotignum sp.]
MNILVTGATGFVGKALFQALLHQRHHLTCTFRKTLEDKGQQSEFNACRQVVVDNIDGNTRWSSCLTGIDQVVHLAGVAHVPDRTGKHGHRQFFSVNHEGTRNLAVQAARQGVKRFVFMSSILVNGSATTAGPFCETSPANPQNAYATAKHEAEKSLQEIASETGMEVVILRSPLVYGPGVKANFLKLLDLVYAGVPMPFGAVANRRSFISLKNLVDAVCLCLCHEKAGNRTFVVSDNQDLSTPELITAIAAAMDRPSRLFAVSDRIMKTGLSLLGKKGVYDRLWGTLQIDPSGIHTRLGWNPPQTVEKGIAETVDWYLNNRRHYIRQKV